MEPVTQESFEEWRHHPVTKRVMKILADERETMKEGLISNAYDDEAEVKGRCRAIGNLLSIDYQDLFQN